MAYLSVNVDTKGNMADFSLADFSYTECNACWYDLVKNAVSLQS